MRSIMQKWGKHIAAVAVFLVLTVVYFAPAVFEGKSIRQGDMEKAVGMGGSQMEKYEKSAQPGEFSVWSDAMFGGMPYAGGYGNPAPKLPGYTLLEAPLKDIGYLNAGMVFTGLVCFYILMCVMGVNWWLALAGSIAFALASYNIIIIEAGHITKAYVIAYMPLTLAGMALLFKRKYLWGGIVFLLGVALSISNGHIQITYYLLLLCLFVYLGYVFAKLREKTYKELGKVTVIMVGCVILAILPNAQNMYAHWDLGKNSIRGATELTTTTASGEKISSGLDKDYAFAWSYGKGELLTLLVPNAYGGGSGGMLGPDSELYKELRAKGAQVGKEVQAPTYWGEKTFTSGPVYFGALVCFLFIIGMFVIRNPIKWWLFAGSVFLIFLALGRNFDGFNDFMFHYLPMYNKFRAVSSILVIAEFTIPLLAIFALKEILSKPDILKLKENRTGVIVTLVLTAGVALILAVAPGVFFSNFSSGQEMAALKQGLPAEHLVPVMTSLKDMREAILTSDAWRSFFIIVIGCLLLFLYQQKKLKASFTLGGIVLLCLIDMWSVNKRYLYDDLFVPKSKQAEAFVKTQADEIILQDTTLYYRVLNFVGFPGNTFNENNTAYWHKSVGGYHAAKLRRYQEMIDHHITPEMQATYQEVAAAGGKMDSVDASKFRVLNMLNTKYFIFPAGQQGQPVPVENPYAYGNAWFVDKVQYVNNANEEIDALNDILPTEIAVVDAKFKEKLKGVTEGYKDSLSAIRLTSYEPNRLVYKTSSAKDGVVVFSEIYYPGWQATIDGQPVDIARADYVLRVMNIPAGEHTIEMWFDPQSIHVTESIAYAALALLLIGVMILVWMSRSRISKKS